MNTRDPAEVADEFLNLCSNHGVRGVLAGVYDTVALITEGEAPNVTEAGATLQAKLQECFALANIIDKHFNERG